MKIGLKLPLFASSELGREISYAELRGIAQQVEAEGFDSLWFMDHLLFRWDQQTTQGVWEAWTFLSALAEATQQIELGSLVLCNQFRNPAILAKMAVTLDEVSSGRFILGLGAGWHKPEFEAFGLPFDHRVSRLEEALKIIRPLLKEGYVDFIGSYYQARHCELLPRGPRHGGPPIMIAGSRPRMLRLTAEYADMWNITGINQPDLLLEPLANLESACEGIGRDPTSLVRTVQIRVAYPEIAPPPSWMETYLSGSNEEIALTFQRFEEIGISHLMIQVGPEGLPTMHYLSEAVKLYRQNRNITGAAD